MTFAHQIEDKSGNVCATGTSVVVAANIGPGGHVTKAKIPLAWQRKSLSLGLVKRSRL